MKKKTEVKVRESTCCAHCGRERGHATDCVRPTFGGKCPCGRAAQFGAYCEAHVKDVLEPGEKIVLPNKSSVDRAESRFTDALVYSSLSAGPKSDPVNHPKHYNSGRFEVAEVIEDWKLDFRTGNSVKYIARAGKKDASKYVEDLEKAIWYLKRAIYVYRAEHEGIDRVKPDEMK